MVIKRGNIVAKKYAQAHLNLYAEKMNDDCLRALISVEEFFAKHQKLIIYLNIPTLDDVTKQQALMKIFEQFNVCISVQKIIPVLLRHRRVSLFLDVIHHLIREYKVRKKITSFDITTSHALDQSQKDAVVAFLQRETGDTIIPLFTIDENLISGIKLHGEKLLLEHSVARKLKQITSCFLERVST